MITAYFVKYEEEKTKYSGDCVTRGTRQLTDSSSTTPNPPPTGAEALAQTKII